MLPRMTSFRGRGSRLTDPQKINLDAVGAGVSLACAIHCAILPLAVATLPALRLNAFFEYAMIGLAFFIGIAALRHGYRKHHRRPAPALLFTTGMMLLIAKQIWQGRELLFLAMALPLILCAHALNYRLCRRPQTC